VGAPTFARPAIKAWEDSRRSSWIRRDSVGEPKGNWGFSQRHEGEMIQYKSGVDIRRGGEGKDQG